MHEPARIDREPVALGDFRDALGERTEWRLAREREHDVLDDRQRFEQREMLEHHADAQLPRMRGIRDDDRLAFPAHFAGIGLDNAVDDLHQRALAGAVFAEHRVNLARHDGQRNVLVRDDAWIDLGDAAQFDAWTRGRCRLHCRRHACLLVRLS